MNLQTQLEHRKTELEKAIAAAEKIMKHPPQGRLDILKQGEHFRYYHITESANSSSPKQKKKKKTSELGVASSIADYDYAKQLLRLATCELHKINKLLCVYDKPTAHECFANLHPGRQALINPILMSDDEYAAHWLASRSSLRNSFPIESEIYTENNEFVRSKSEKIIADKLFLLGIPYKYEEPVVLGNKTLFPDFTILNKSTRQVYYWEHFGLFDNPDYMKNAMQKIDLYNRNHIVLGKNLLLTFETQSHPLSVKQIENIIHDNFVS